MTKPQDIQPPDDQPDETPAQASPSAARRVLVEVTLSVEHTTRDGVTHKPDTTVELSAAEARHVLHIGHGRTTAPKENQS